LATSYDDTQTIDFEHPTEWVDRPPESMDVSKAYSISMPTNAMFPRYLAGERLIVHPNKPLTLKCYVIVTTKGNHVKIGQFLGWESSNSPETSIAPVKLTTMIS